MGVDLYLERIKKDDIPNGVLSKMNNSISSVVYNQIEDKTKKLIFDWGNPTSVLEWFEKNGYVYSGYEKENCILTVLNDNEVLNELIQFLEDGNYNIYSFEYALLDVLKFSLLRQDKYLYIININW